MYHRDESYGYNLSNNEIIMKQGERHMSDETDTAVDLSLDVKGLNCPLPILKTKKALQKIDIGHVLEVFTTDPGSVPDFNAFCRQTGHILIDTFELDASFRFLIRKTK